MAVSCGQRLLSCLQASQPTALRGALLATVPEDWKQFTDRRNEPKTFRWKEKQQRRKDGSCGLDSSWEERLSAAAAAPLCGLSYEEQLKVKYEKVKVVLQALASLLEELGADLTQAEDGLCCPLQPVIPSPVINGYRNKSTFSVNHGPDGDPKMVGLYVGTGRGRDMVCVRANHLLNMPQAHFQVAQRYEEFLRQSPPDSCLLFHTGGHWREVVVRSNRKGDTVAIIASHPQHLSPEECCAQKELLKDFFTHGPGAACSLTSLYFQESTMVCASHQQSPFELLFGEPHIFEEILNLKFRISPDAFFQVNAAGAEVLYQTIGELSGADRKAVLLDICCGTGAIGLSLAGQASKVIGVELVDQVVEDARRNAAFNGIASAEFHAGKAEVILPHLLAAWPDGQPLAAVVNPSRAGFHYHVVRAIRNCKAIRTLVYVSCKPGGESFRNFLECCCPSDPKKKLTGEPFAPILAVPVDLFPHTTHCDVVLLFAH
ncbi:tRNA (uracil(54)-C(5))-methyltransferase homolog isoform X2 [Varanus komodoensis]|uniref:tRNA (uracil(54)-C(5))-methyltransferase homolog isoform X2 n=1 Tax=Varanus komodoensis TaxID=61221 RepID=UPI001CF7D06A|nr:tRNA (uracil(54)-C(5))-methyltransferase homolog isoform X2 [Varanus komodoensis]